MVAALAISLSMIFAAGVVSLLVFGRRWRIRRRIANLHLARRIFHQRREWLEARFMTLAAQSGKPRGLTWAECDFDNGVRFARDRHSGKFRALVGLTIRFEAIVGGDLEDNPNVKNLRAATAVFRMERNLWVTDGLAIFNLNPEQTIRHFHHELEDLNLLVK